jgi:hypothetical protein
MWNRFYPSWDRCYDIKIFSEKIGVFLLKLLLVFAKIVIITLVFEKTPFFRRKSQKIVIITSTPESSMSGVRGHPRVFGDSHIV